MGRPDGFRSAIAKRMIFTGLLLLLPGCYTVLHPPNKSILSQKAQRASLTFPDGNYCSHCHPDRSERISSSSLCVPAYWGPEIFQAMHQRYGDELMNPEFREMYRPYYRMPYRPELDDLTLGEFLRAQVGWRTALKETVAESWEEVVQEYVDFSSSITRERPENSLPPDTPAAGEARGRKQRIGRDRKDSKWTSTDDSESESAEKKTTGSNNPNPPAPKERPKEERAGRDRKGSKW